MNLQRHIQFLFPVGFLSLVASAIAQEVVPQVAASPTPVPNSVPPLTGSQLYFLVMAAVIGSLGTLALLLGLDKVLMVVVMREDNTSADQKRLSAASIAQILPLVIQGITVILVVLAVLLLALLKVISAEGTLSILASVVGYVLGKASQKKPGKDDEQA